MEVYASFPMQSCCCSVEWLATYNNLVEYVQLLIFLFWLLGVFLLSPKVLNFFLIKLKGCS